MQVQLRKCGLYITLQLYCDIVIKVFPSFYMHFSNEIQIPTPVDENLFRVSFFDHLEVKVVDVFEFVTQ